jgi:hypothetical protein
MYFPLPNQPIDYLLIGHLTQDLTPSGPILGGSALYSALTVQAMGMRVGIISSWTEEMDLSLLGSIPYTGIVSDQATTFENIYTPEGRVQIIRGLAERLDYHLIPDFWRSTPIVHLAPLVQEVEPSIINHMDDSYFYATPQGWLRDWDENGRISPGEWPEFTYVLNRTEVAVISVEDVGYDQARIDELAAACKLLVVTEGDNGSKVYWNGEIRHFTAPEVKTVDPTGSGDIYAAIYFCHYFRTEDPWESARMATELASLSTTRFGPAGIPTVDEIRSFFSEPTW